MRVIVDINNLHYFEGKAHELITEGGRSRTEEQDKEAYIESMKRAIQVLTLCVAHIENQKD